MITPGQYPAKIISHAITETKAGEPQAAVTIKVEIGDGMTQNITWYGSFKEGKAREITIKALLTCGLQGNNPGGSLEIGKEVMATVEEKPDDKGVLRTRVAWINPLNQVRNVIPKDLAAAKLAALEGFVMAARQSNGGAGSDEIPF